MTAQNWFWIVVGVAIAVALLAFGISTFYVNVLWFEQLGYSSVFWTMLKAKWLVAIGAGLIFFLIIFVNLRIPMRGRAPLNIVGGVVTPIPAPDSRRIGWIILIVSIIIGVLGGLSGYANWSIVYKHLNATDFGITDPFLNKEAGFYVFSLPFHEFVEDQLWVAFIIALIFSGFFYYLLGDLRYGERRLTVSRQARTHISILAAVLFGLKVWQYQIRIWNLMYSPRGAAFGASYTDIHAQVPAYKALMVVALAGVVFSLLGLFMRNFRWIGYAVLGLIVMSIAVGTAYPAFVQQFTVSPNEIAYEIPFIEANIKFTRNAFGLDEIKLIDYPADDDLTQEDVLNNMQSIENLRLWDYRVLKDTFSQIQEIRMYYKFHDVDIDRYVVNGKLRQVSLSPRELDIDLLPQEAKTWVNLHLKYTHGYGLVMSPVRDVTKEGMPAFYFMDVPPKTTTDLVLNRPEIYFGELTNHYIIVNTKEPEFDYPRLDAEIIEPTFYEGSAGIPLSGFFRKLAFTLRFTDYQILVSGAITPDSRVIMNRNIISIINTIAPFFQYDSDPYLVLADGKLYWIIDGYTTSRNYPYSQPDTVTGVNYIRNSVKVVIDAYNGQTTFYCADDKDPILQTYEKIFPDLMTPMEEMPPEILKHIRFPEDMFSIQARMFTTYHMTDPRVYYNKEDYWEVPRELYGNQEIVVEPYYLLIALPEKSELEYVLMLPFTPRGKPNMTAWLAARCDPEHYGEMLLYRLPKDKHVPGPMQVESLISQNPSISEAMTLWGQVGSQVIRGNLLILPMDGAFLYVEPLYIQAEKVKIPELKRVIMYASGKVVMANTVEEGLNQLLGLTTKPIPEYEGDVHDIAGLVKQANQLWLEAQERIRSGDWAGYGELMEELGRVLEELQELQGGTLQ
ncbi:MAG TPA: UPF0182 family protein [Bacillota bacterium]|nr:UPF0182 family protein [Bacillota bacterium]HOL11483.1 UPF0182 family protein [Bacillota bacterium]HPP60376.1 UPF0182 family protein [Bacillota bacterium]HPV13609.1 UPF0182 family protein [Bacillota bacterium]HPZ77639.1 UPF0182 family protein [Bacillota bacterium]